MTGGSASPMMPTRNDGEIQLEGSTLGMDVGMRVNAGGIDYVVLSIDGDRFTLSTAPPRPTFTGDDFRRAMSVSYDDPVQATRKTRAPRCCSCNAINAHGARRCTMCRRGRVR